MYVIASTIRGKTLIGLTLFSIYILGIVSVLVIPISRVADFKNSLARKLGAIEKPLYPQLIDTSRYQFSLVPGESINGVFQLAQYEASKFFALDRFSGALYTFQIRNEDYFKEFLGNIYEELGFLSNPDFAADGYKIDKAGNKLNSNPLIFATAFDIEYAFGRLYLSLTLPSKDQSCTQMSLYSFEVFNNGRVDITEGNLIFHTPCILDKKNPTMWGGRIAHSKENVYLSIGEQRYDPSGFPKTDKVSQSEIKNEYSVFGKILEFKPNGSTYRIFSSGHRNAQGLYFSNDDQNVWESEHGPFGGDEVNLIKDGGHYGWPYRTLGKPYGIDNGNILEINRSVNPSTSIDLELRKFGAKSGNHSDYLPPIMSWTNSGSFGIGAGQLIKIQENSTFNDWHDNLLVVHMRDFSLHRLILHGDSVMADERINLGFRVRDFILNDRGYLIMATDEGRLLIYKTTSSDFEHSN